MKNQAFASLAPEVEDRFMRNHGPRPPEGDCEACQVLFSVSQLLRSNQWPDQVPKALNAQPESGFDLPGLLFHLGGMDRQVKVDVVADKLMTIMCHLYPRWQTLRPVYWDIWRVSQERMERAQQARDELRW